MNFHDISVESATGETTSLSTYRGKTCLVVNVASQCGLTPQYRGLEALYREFKDKNFEVLGFPCNQFGAQEPGTNAQICEFAQSKYDVTFPIFSKIEVNGDQASDLYKYLKSEKPNEQGVGDIAWNFTKFLVSADGKVLQRFEPPVKPEEIAENLRDMG